MTVNYQLDVSSGASPFTFLRLLSRWKGSIWKSVSLELGTWIFLFYAIHFSYKFLLAEEYKLIFDKISIHLEDRMRYIPLTFMLGFFVSTISIRWRSALTAMPFIENVALYVSLNIPGKTETDVLYRRSIVRYLTLHQILVFRDISMQVRRRFPTMQYVIDAGFMSQEEFDTIKLVNCKPGDKYWIPISWANALSFKALEEEKIRDGSSLGQIITAIKEFRAAMETLIKFDQIPIPIAYPQVVFLAVRVYFMLCLISRQFLDSSAKSKTQMPWPVPIMTCLEILFVLGWMKVAEVLLNPLGEDDDDFEINWIIDKNIATGMAIVDDCHADVPALFSDRFSDPDYRPVYAAKSETPGRLAGSAATVELAKSDDAVQIVLINHDAISQANSDLASIMRYRMGLSRNPSQRSAPMTPRSPRRAVKHEMTPPVLATLNEHSEKSLDKVEP